MPDIPLNPSTIVINGALVSATNPLPVTSVAAGAPGTAVTLNPRTFIINGALVSATNPLPVSGITVGPDADAVAWRDAVVSNGGTVSVGRLTIVSNFITAEKAAGTWALTDDYWGMWAEDTIGALVSIKQRRMGISVGAPSFTPDRNYTFNGTTNYLNTGFIPSTHAVAMTGTNLRLAIYERTNVTANVSSMGTTDSATSNLTIRARNSTSATAFVNSAFIVYALPVANSQGYTAASRNGAGAAESAGYKNGVAMTQSGATTFGTTLPVGAMYIGCQNGAGVAASFRANSVGFACVGAALSAAQEVAQYNNVQAWATSIGANV